MAFTFPLNPIAKQIATTPIGQRYMYISGEWRSIGLAKGALETAGVTISATMFFIGSPVTLEFSSIAELPSSGVNPPISFNLSSGQLPTGLIINSGIITGVPLIASENYSFIISAVDSIGYLVNTIIFNGQVSNLVTEQYLSSVIAPTALASAIVSLSPNQLTALASAIVSASPASALSLAISAMIQSLSTDSSATPTLWSNGGIPQYS